jgi:hypothetical protein
MRANIRAQNQQLLQSVIALNTTSKTMEEPASLIVTIPDTVEEGMSFFVVTKCQKKFLVECPVGATSGSKIRVLIPDTNGQENRTDVSLRSCSMSKKSQTKPSSTPFSYRQHFKKFDIVVPPGANPNQLLAVNIYGKRMPVRLPSTIVEGQTITLKVPLQDAVGDLELDYEQNDTSLTGGWSRTIRIDDLKFQWANKHLQKYQQDSMSARPISNAVIEKQNAIRDIAFVRNLILMTGNDERMRTGMVDLVLPSDAVTESEFRLRPISKPLVTYASTAHHIQSRSTLDVKLEWLYQNVFDPIKRFSSQDGSTVRLVVRRSSLLADSVNCVMSLSPKEMSKSWHLVFVGEPALDYGGVMRGKQLIYSFPDLQYKAQ